MASSILHAGLPYPIAAYLYTVVVDFYDSSGIPTDPTSPDTEYSLDGGVTFTDCTNEITTGGGNGVGWITLEQGEINAASVVLACKSSNCTTSIVKLNPRFLPTIASATLTGASNVSSFVINSLVGVGPSFNMTGLICKVVSGTGSPQARIVTGLNIATVSIWPNFETQLDNTSNVEFCLPTGATRETLLPSGGIR